MFSLLRNRFGAPGLLAVVALVFAMVGGAYAAKKYVITSTKQIKPSVLKSLEGATGPAGPAGAAGAQGPKGDAGAKGDAGTPGLKGATGPTGATGATGATGSTGATGVTGPVGPTLPSGVTETGSWGARFTATSMLPVTLNLPLSSVPEGIFVGTAASAPGCPGLVDGIPTAESGKLCVYASTLATAVFTSFLDPTANLAPGTSKSGALMSFNCTGTCIAYGTYAAKAP